MTRRRLRSLAGILALLGFVASGDPSLGATRHPAHEATEAPDIIRALIGGKLDLDMRFRWENAKIDGFRRSNAVTLRTRLAYGTKPYYGFMAYAGFENIVALKNENYFDGIAPNSGGRTPIPDPEHTEIDQAFLKWSSDGLGDGAFARSRTSLLGGRTKIVLDDSRFIGNVGWRQNQQTYDAGLIRSSLGLEGLATTYGYLFQVHRIFGDQGASGAPTLDFDSDSHFLNATYSGFRPLAITVFGYWLDFSNSPANSSDTYGFRATGKTDLGEDLYVGYTGSYAHQQQARRNPTHYDANYYNIEGVLGYEPWVAVTLGYEVLGSDGGLTQFRTPLATAHKFNGWADVFVDNGGVIGLEDLYVAITPTLPCGLKGRLVYHHFQSNDGNLDYGDEIDGILSKEFDRWFTLLAKFAYYDGGRSGRADRHRIWLEARFQF